MSPERKPNRVRLCRGVWGRFRRTGATLLSGALLSAALLSGAGCSHPAPPPAPPPIGALLQNSFTRAWLADLPMNNDRLSALFIQGDTLFAFSAKKNVVSLNRTAGTINFVTHVTGADVKEQPPVRLADQYVFATGVSLEIFDTMGHFLRNVPLTAPLSSGAVGQARTIFFGVDDPDGGRVLCIDLNRSFATERWQLLVSGGNILSTPVLCDQYLYVGTEAGVVYALTPSRDPLWNTAGHIFTTSGPIIGDLKTDPADVKPDQAGIYIPCRDTKLYCVNALTGKLKWQFYAGAPLSDGPVVTRDLIYQLVPGMGIACVDKNDPNFNRGARWTYPGATQFLSQDEHYAYLLEPHSIEKKSFLHHETLSYNVIVAVDKQTGRRAFASHRSDFSTFASNPTDNLIYAGFANGVVLAAKPVLRPGQVGELVLLPVPAKLTPTSGTKAVALAR